MDALTPEQRAQHGIVAQALFLIVMQTEELPDGFRFAIPDDPAAYLMASEFMSLEHRCCPFFYLALEIEPNGSALWLRITGDHDDIKPFMRAEFGLPDAE